MMARWQSSTCVVNVVVAVLTAEWSVINHIGVMIATTPRVLIQALMAVSVNMSGVSRPGLSVRRAEVPQLLRMTATVCRQSNCMGSERYVMVACQRGVPSCKMTGVTRANPARVANSDVMVVAACVG